VFRALTVTLAAFLLAAVSGPARAQPPADTVQASAPAPVTDPLAAADAAVEAGDLPRATQLYQQVLRDHPDGPEAAQARRALNILAATARLAPAPAVTAAGPDVDGPGDVVMRNEPFSRRTSERLRLTTWEKLDFGVTSFLYGMSVGFSYGLSTDDPAQDDDNATIATSAMALGALTYTVGAVTFLKLADPDRGDLPLALAIASYVPTTTLLASNILRDNADDRTTSLAVAISGVVSVPFAVFAAARLNLDPGDTQLVRDAGFWGLVLGTTGALGFARTKDEFGFTQDPSGRTVASLGAAGLYGGLALGAVAASQSEVSLERVRVTTWSGYGGGLLGGLLTAASSDTEEDVFRGLCVGSAVGLLVGFIATSTLDGIPPETPVISGLRRTRLQPAVMTSFGPAGRPQAAWGVSGPLDL
jgi:hypothetical protein